MVLNMFAVYDSKAVAFMAPFFMPRVEQAKRVFADCVNDPKHAFGLNPGDYTLFWIGSFEDAKGTVSAQIPENLGLASAYRRSVVADLSEAKPATVAELREAFNVRKEKS